VFATGVLVQYGDGPALSLDIEALAAQSRRLRVPFPCLRGRLRVSPVHVGFQSGSFTY